MTPESGRLGRTSSFHFISLLCLLVVFIILLIYRTNANIPQHVLLVISPSKSVQTFDLATARYLGTFGNVSDPFSIAVGSDSFVYIVDNAYPPTLTRFAKQGKYVDSIRLEGSGDALAIGPNGLLYYTDFSSGSVGCVNVSTFPPSSLDVFIPSGVLQSPQGIAIASDGTVLIADTERGRVIATHISHKDGANTSIFTTQVMQPQFVTIDENRGLVLVTDLTDVKAFSLDGGKFLGSFVSPLNASEGSMSVAMSPYDNDLYIAAYGSSSSFGGQVQRFNGTTGSFIQTIINSRLSKPSGLAFLSRTLGSTSDVAPARVSLCRNGETKATFHGSKPGFDIGLSVCPSSWWASAETEKTSVDFKSLVSPSAKWTKKQSTTTDNNGGRAVTYSSTLLRSRLSGAINVSSDASSLVSFGLRLNGSDVTSLFKGSEDFIEWGMEIINTQEAGAFTGKYHAFQEKDEEGKGKAVLYTFERFSSAMSIASIPPPPLQLRIVNTALVDGKEVDIDRSVTSSINGTNFVVSVKWRIPTFTRELVMGEGCKVSLGGLTSHNYINHNDHNNSVHMIINNCGHALLGMMLPMLSALFAMLMWILLLIFVVSILLHARRYSHLS